MRILIVDDHAFVRRGIREILDEEGLAKETGEAESVEQALEHLSNASWDLVLLDLKLRDSMGTETLRRILEAHPEQAVLIVSGEAPEQFAVRLISMGAKGYLSKELAPDQLLKAVPLISEGRRYISPAIAELMAENMVSGEPLRLPPHQSLSKREQQVFHKLALGESLTGIAEEMGISVKTVSTYRKRVLQKLDLKTNAQLAIYAAREGFVESDEIS